MSSAQDTADCPAYSDSRSTPPSAASVVRWAELGPEHFGRVSDCTGKPQDLLCAELVCVAWRSALHEGEQRAWRRLCTAWYPSLAARIVGDMGADEYHPEALYLHSGIAPPYSSHESVSTSVPSSSSSSAAPDRASDVGSPDLAPTREVIDVSSPTWSLHSQEVLLQCAGSADADTSPRKGRAGPFPAEGLTAPCIRWRALFQRRYLRQKTWDSRRQKKMLASRPGTGVVAEPSEEEQPGAKPPARPNGRSAGKEAAPEGHRAPRTRICKRCGADFDPRSGHLDTCHWHFGRFVSVDADGVLVGAKRALGRDHERRVQNILKAQNRKKTSKKAAVVAFIEHEDGVTWRWSCCGEENLVAPGCAKGRHS
mmetsp:Transcript_90840/g.257311  ORF Transcript_90840/g.257311 Transcript_90840/m.257311 type:complete len:368 (-) Transcript_90840:120-1223(-)